MRLGLKACLTAAALAAVPHVLAQSAPSTVPIAAGAQATAPPAAIGAGVSTLPAADDPAGVASQTDDKKVLPAPVPVLEKLDCSVELKVVASTYPECYAAVFVGILTCKLPKPVIKPGPVPADGALSKVPDVVIDMPPPFKVPKATVYYTGHSLVHPIAKTKAGELEFVIKEKACTKEKLVFVGYVALSEGEHLPHGKYDAYIKVEATESCSDLSAEVAFEIDVLCLVFKKCYAAPAWWKEDWGSWGEHHGYKKEYSSDDIFKICGLDKDYEKKEDGPMKGDAPVKKNAGRKASP